MRTLWNAVRAIAWTVWGLGLTVVVWAIFLEPSVDSVTLALWWLTLPAAYWFWSRVVTVLDRYGR